jgi:hypothetical protein
MYSYHSVVLDVKRDAHKPLVELLLLCNKTIQKSIIKSITY